MIVCAVTVALQQAFEVAQEPLRTFPFPAKPEVKDHRSHDHEADCEGPLDVTPSPGTNMTTELKIGDPAPDFKATAVGGIYGGGQEVKFADFTGSTLVLYFTRRTIPRGALLRPVTCAIPGVNSNLKWNFSASAPIALKVTKNSSKNMVIPFPY
jgi:hypothetical protein